MQAAIIFRIFWDFSMLYQVFISPQAKRCAIITFKHGIYEHDQCDPSSCQTQNFVITNKMLLKNGNKLFPEWNVSH